MSSLQDFLLHVVTTIVEVENIHSGVFGGYSAEENTMTLWYREEDPRPKIFATHHMVVLDRWNECNQKSHRAFFQQEDLAFLFACTVW